MKAVSDINFSEHDALQHLHHDKPAYEQIRESVRYLAHCARCACRGLAAPTYDEYGDAMVRMEEEVDQQLQELSVTSDGEQA